VDAVVQAYVEAWNKTDPADRDDLLAHAVVDEVEVIEPPRRFQGRAALAERIVAFGNAWPGARIEITTNIDEHHEFARYGWRIADAQKELLTGTDVVERADDGRLRRVLMFFGALKPTE
jgi:hypothetical protein